FAAAVRGRRLVPAVAGLTSGPIFAVLATQSSPVVGALLIVAALVAGTIVVWPSLGFFLTAAVVPLERIGRLTDDSSMYGFSLMRAVGLITLAGALAQHMLLK